MGLGSARFSPDGTRLLFAGVPGTIPQAGWGEGSWLDALRPAVAEAHGAPWDLWVWEDGQRPRQLTRLGQDLLSGAWSPDGRRIALVSDMGLYLMEGNGDNLKRVELQAHPQGLAWLES